MFSLNVKQLFCFTLIRTEGTRATDRMKKLFQKFLHPNTQQAPFPQDKFPGAQKHQRLRMRTKTAQSPHPPRAGSAPTSLSYPGSGGTVLQRRWADFLPSAVHCFLLRDGIRVGEAAVVEASLPPGTGRTCSRPADSGSEEGIPRRLPLPEGVRAVAPASVPAAARAPVGATSGRGRGGGWGPWPPLPAASRRRREGLLIASAVLASP